VADEADRLAFRVFNLLADGMGGLNWQGLPLMCGWLGAADIEGLMERLAIIKTHRQQQKKDE
jgi:hypothetical protein